MTNLDTLSTSNLEKQLKNNLSANWQLMENPKRLEINYQLEDFSTVLELVNQIGQLAQKQNHHPNLLLHDYNQLTVSLNTHQTNSITTKDLALAQAIDQLDY